MVTSKEVRLADEDIRALRDIFKKHFLENDTLWLFGSRTNMTKKGGDIDLYVETNAPTIEDAIARRALFLWELVGVVGEQKIDLVLHILYLRQLLPIYDVAKLEGVKLV